MHKYEFCGKGNGTYTALGRTVDLTPTITRGGSAYLDVGCVYFPADNDNLSIDFSLSGMAGKVKGVSAGASGKYIF